MATATKNVSNSTALVRSEFAGLASIDIMREALSENVGDEGFSPLQLDRVKMPSGGGIAWEVPTLEGDSDALKVLEGVIVYWTNARTLWAPGEPGSGEPPLCRSSDGKVGKGTPGGSCSVCPHAQWGSGKGGGQECKAARILFLLREDGILPIVVRISAGSLKSASQYGLRLASHGLMYRHVVTRIGLEKVTSKGGQVYSQATFQLAGKLSPELKAQADLYHEQIKAASEATDKLADDLARQEARPTSGADVDDSEAY